MSSVMPSSADRPASAGASRRMASGAVWVIGLRFSMRFLGFANTAILARLLMPEDFGIVALATSSLAALEALGTFGMLLALIRYQDAGREHYDTAWTVNLIKGVVTTLIIVALAEPLAAAMSEPRLVPVMWVVGLANLLQSLENVGMIEFRKDLRFDVEFRYFAAIRVAGMVLTIAAAVILRDYWALIIGTVAQSVVRLILSYTMHPFRPRLSLKAWRAMFGFSLWAWLASLTTFVRRQGRTLIVGGRTDATGVGTFSMASELSHLSNSEIVQPIMRVLFSGLAKQNRDPEQFRATLSKAMGILLLMHLPVCVGLALVTEPLVRVLLGTAWLGMVPVMQILAVAAAFSLPRQMIGIALVAYGRPRLDAAAGTLYAAVELPLFIAGLWYGGVEGGAYVILGATVFDCVVSLSLGWRAFGLTPAGLIGRNLRTLAATAAMTGAVLLAGHGFADSGDFGPALVELLALSGLGAAVFVLVQMLLWWASGRPDGPETYGLTLAYERFGWLRRFGPPVRTTP